MDLRAISLFSGAGGLDLAAKWSGIRTVCYVEIDKYAQACLQTSFRNGNLDEGWIWDDVCTFDGRPWRGVDIVYGGFPCQPHSRAGKRQGAKDKRNLWPEFMRIVRECWPSFVLGENVSGIFDTGYAIEVLADLEEAGYCATPISIRACDVGAPHERERIFFLAHANSLGHLHGRFTEQSGEAYNQAQPPLATARGKVAYSQSEQDRRGESLRNRSDSGASSELEHSKGFRPSEAFRGRQGQKQSATTSQDVNVANTERGRMERRRRTDFARKVRHDEGGVRGFDGPRSSEQETKNLGVGQADPVCERCQRSGCSGQTRSRELITDHRIWPSRPSEEQYCWEPQRVLKSRMVGVLDGLAYRSNRLRCTGGGVVAQCAVPIFQKIKDMALTCSQ